MGYKVPRESAHLHFRVPNEAKLLYSLLPSSKKRAVKKALIATILALHEGGETVRDSDDAAIYNITVNINEARAEAAVNVDLAELADKLEEALAFLGWIANNPYYKPIHGKAAKAYQNIADVVRRMRGVN